MTRQTIDLMFLACNRLRFTQESFDALIKNTDWLLVRELSIYDDGSIDGTFEWLEAHAADAPVPVRLVRTAFGSPVSAMVHFIEAAHAPLLAKIDNDTMVPPGWLAAACGVLDRHPDLHFIGIEALCPLAAGVVERSVSPSRCISGLGLYRRVAFERSRPVMYSRWYGFEEWQAAQHPWLRVGWIDPAMPVFLLDRCPFEPWRSLADEYVRRGWQRPWDRYPAHCRLWQWRWPSERLEIPAPRSLAPGYPGFVGAMRIKNEAPHISEVVTRALSLCERVFVFDDHSSDDTVKTCESLGDRVAVSTSPFTGLDEARDKNYLLQSVIAWNPRWVFWIDGDELLERGGAEQLVEAATVDGQAAAFSLRIAYAWDDLEHIRVDGIYGTFFRPSLFRVESQAAHRLYFRATGNGGNFHCGNIPQGLNGPISRLEVRLKHLGYVTAQQRRSKYQWYTTVDPSNSHEDYYRHLIDLPGARFASASPQIVPWVE
jgi:glycosyltransferase involved in cell wall biosynthesis